MFDMMKPFYHPDEYLLSRRQALIVLASLPLGMLIDVQQRLKAPFPQEDLLPVCAASLTACWHLIQGREFAALERALSRYAVFLVTWAQQPSVYQKAAAYLASQACLLIGLVATHQLRSPKNLQRRLAYCKQAVEHAKTSGDPTLLVMALIHFGYTLYYLEQLENMLQAYQEAAQYSNEVLPLVRSKLFAGLAHAYAQNGQNQEALRSIQKARAIFPGDSSIVPSFVLADCGLFSLIMDEGRTHLVLGQNENNATSAAFYYKQSEKALAQIEELSATIVIPERFRIEIVNQQALLSVKVGNLENFRKYLAEGAHGAQMLQSEKRRQEVIANWKEARNMWPHESQIRELADLFL